MAMRVGRNSIPKVNPNPRPPNEPRYNRNRNGGTTAPRGSTRTTAVGAAHALPRRQQGVGVGKALPGSQGPGGSASATSSPPPSLAPPIDPRDSQYWKDVAQLKFDTDIAGGNLDVEEAFEKSAYDREKAAREYAKPLEVQHMREGANVGGTIYSTSHQENLGNLAQEQFGKDASALENYQYALSQRLGKRATLKDEYEKGIAELLEGATGRQAENEINRPSLADEEAHPVIEAMEKRAKQGQAKAQKKFQRGASIGGNAAKGGSTGKGGGTNAPRGSNATTNVNAGKPAQQQQKKKKK